MKMSDDDQIEAAKAVIAVFTAIEPEVEVRTGLSGNLPLMLKLRNGNHNFAR